MPRASRYNAGTLYPILHKLESRGLVVSYKEKLDSGRERKYYQITKAGIAQLEQYQIRFTDVVCFRISDDNSIYVKGDYDIYIFYRAFDPYFCSLVNANIYLSHTPGT